MARMLWWGAILTSTACAQVDATARTLDLSTVAHREFRAAWVATVTNIDWPSRPGLPVAQQRAELTALVDAAAALRLNALIFQVRPMCDALYASPLEPWSEWLTGERGRAPAPAWDPLAYAIEAAHAHGLELHAWFNPFRVRHAKAQPVRSIAGLGLPARAVRYGEQLWLDPGDPGAQRHTLAVVRDVVTRYDIDGVHVDDYFYPYPERGLEFPDAPTFASYRSEGGGLGRADWRRSNVDRFVAAMYAAVKRAKPWVKVGISPFGIARPGVPAGIEAGLDQFTALYADPQRWLAQGWCDYLAPQLYWRIEPKAQSFPVLLRWWTAPQQNPAHRHVWPGLYTSRTMRGFGDWPADEIAAQVDWTRRVGGATGQVHFSLRALLPGASAAAALASAPYAEPALVPASPWLDATPPSAPHVVGRRDGGDVVLTTADDASVPWLAVYAADARRRWRLQCTLAASAPAHRVPLGRGDIAIAVTAIDRCGNQSAAVEVWRQQ